MEKVEIADSFWHLDTGPRSMVRPRVSLFAAPPCRPTRQVTCPHLRSCVFAAAGVGPRSPALALCLSVIPPFPLRLVHLRALAAAVRGAGQDGLLPPRARAHARTAYA
ncbi:hypothetical protein B0H13DRAFT_1902693 [Mycena leptocephala]|nr:hypothetical protein B0H13DRAFT_1902693 [Mycena leptocephala]